MRMQAFSYGLSVIYLAMIALVALVTNTRLAY